MKKIASGALDVAEVVLVFAVCNYLLWVWVTKGLK